MWISRHWSDGKTPAFSWLHLEPLQSGRREFKSRLAHVTSVILTMAATPERTHFKRSFGQANHFLVTILVGLNAVKTREAVPPPNLPAAWDPKDARRSADRSEAFAIQGALVFLVTALDQYLGEVARLTRPKSIPLAAAIDAATKSDKGLRGRVQAFADFSGASQTAELALVESAVQWRNRLIHVGSNARFNAELRGQLIEHTHEYETDYRHLEPDRMIRSFADSAESPSLKEIAGMITATHRLIRRVDAGVLATLDYDQYLAGVLCRHLGEVSQDMAHDRANRMWGRTEGRAGRAILALARQSGFTDPTEDTIRGITDTTVTQLAGLSSRKALATFRPS